MVVDDMINLGHDGIIPDMIETFELFDLKEKLDKIPGALPSSTRH
jgi:hypothetical protein